MPITLDVERITDFCNRVFATLDAGDLLPDDLAQPFDEYERLPLLLIRKIAAVGTRAGFLEWSSKVLQDEDADQAAIGAPLVQLEQWIADNAEMFDKHTLEHLERSIGGRAHQWIWDNEQVWFSPAEAAERLDMAESTFRNKAAAGEIPGAQKKGKQWILPSWSLRQLGYDV